jgi:RNA polymerase sigma-70 factor (ECF subfamily)
MDVFRRKAIHQAMVRLADGDRSAMETLVHELWPVILSFAQRGLAHEQDAEDVAQEVFLRICARASDFDRQRDGLSWAFGIASYEIMTHRRRRGRRRESPANALAHVADEAPTQEQELIREQLEAALVAVVGALSDEDRTTLGLLPHSSAFAASGATLRKRRQRALDRLRVLWRKLYGDT